LLRVANISKSVYFCSQNFCHPNCRKITYFSDLELPLISDYQWLMLVCDCEQGLEQDKRKPTTGDLRVTQSAYTF